MARYYADIKGSRGAATRMGTASSGISSHTRSWDLGTVVRVEPSYVGGEQTERDRVTAVLTGGSNSHWHPAVYLQADRYADGSVRLEVVIDGKSIYSETCKDPSC